MNTNEVLGLLILVVGIPFAIACAVMFFITWWKIFEKGGEGGWAIFVPFYNAYILGKVAGGVSFGIGVLIVVMINFFGGLVGIAMDSDGNAVEILSCLPWVVMHLIIAFKLGGKFGCDVWLRAFLTVPYLNAFPHLYLALSKKYVYSEKPLEASAGLFATIIILMFLIILLMILLIFVIVVFVGR